MTAGRTPTNDRGMFIIMLVLILLSLAYGLLTFWSAYDRVGHGGLALDISSTDDDDQIVRNSF